jgi:hypothetical protein
MILIRPKLISKARDVAVIRREFSVSHRRKPACTSNLKSGTPLPILLLLPFVLNHT